MSDYKCTLKIWHLKSTVWYPIVSTKKSALVNGLQMRLRELPFGTFELKNAPSESCAGRFNRACGPFPKAILAR
jgi:hypothetical protein